MINEAQQDALGQTTGLAGWQDDQRGARQVQPE
jgi:hypothetical protein